MVAIPGNRARALGIFIDDEQIEVNEAATWMMYALTRFEFLRNHGEMPKVLVDEIILPSIEEEIAGRQAVYTKNWEKAKSGLSESARPSFNAMKAADEAGFVKEFVWIYCKRPNWVQPEGLQLDEFKTWASKNIPEHPEKAPVFAVLFGRDVRPGAGK